MGVVSLVFILVVTLFMFTILIAVRSKRQEEMQRSKRQEEIQRYDEKVSLEKLQLHTNFIEKALPQLSDFEVLQCFLDFLHAILLKGLKNEMISSEITQVVTKALQGDEKPLLGDRSCSTSV